jgi:hypothetical protein
MRTFAVPNPGMTRFSDALAALRFRHGETRGGCDLFNAGTPMHSRISESRTISSGSSSCEK